MDRFFSPTRLLLLGLIAAWGSCPLSAAMLGLTSPTATVASPSDEFTVGYKFHVGSTPLAVTALGVWDEGNPLSPGLAEAHEIAIWTTAGGTPLVDETIGPSGSDPSETQVNAWLFVPLNTPLVLAAGTDYVIGVFDGTGGLTGDKYHGSLNNNLTPVFNAPEVTYVERLATAGPGPFTFPTADGDGTDSAWDMPNFEFIPEPASFSLLALGSVAAMAGRRSRQRNAIMSAS